MDKPELPRSVEQMVDAFGEFYWKEVSSVFKTLSVENEDAFIKTKEFFINLWESSNSSQDWPNKTNEFSQGNSELSDSEKDLLWEEIYFEITEPMALAFRKKKAETARSLATFGKMLAAAGFLAGLAYSLYLYGVKF